MPPDPSFFHGLQVMVILAGLFWLGVLFLGWLFS